MLYGASVEPNVKLDTGKGKFSVPVSGLGLSVQLSPSAHLLFGKIE